jgi:hypothetical protein
MFVNVNAVFAQEMVEEAPVVQVGEKDEFQQQKLSYPTVESVEGVSQKFGVTPSWIHSEMVKGYLLEDIYEGLLERQHGGSYERYMQLRYSNAFEAKVRNKRCGPCVKVVVEVGKAAVKAAKPYVDDAVKATVNFTKNVADDVVQGSKSLYQNITTGRSVKNIQTDVSKKTFEKNLESSGWSKTSRGEINTYSKDGAKYTTRNESNQGSKTADYTPNSQKKASVKIRLKD